MKCPKCQTEKQANEFRQRPGTNRRQSWCIDCHNKYSVLKKIGKKLAAIQYLGGKCQNPKCPLAGQHIHPACFDFHHKDPTTKEFSWGQVRGLSWSKIKVELDKCQLLCCYCHRLQHFNPEHAPTQAEIEQYISGEINQGELLTIGGETKNLTEWCNHFGLVDYHTTRLRLKRGWDPLKAMTFIPKAASNQKKVTIDGRTLTLGEWLTESGIDKQLYRNRISHGWSIERALSTKLGG